MAALKARWPYYVALFGALALLRLEQMRDHGFTLANAWQHSLATGLANDLVLVALVELAVAGLSLFLPRMGRLAWVGASLFLVTATLGNALYFKFFGGHLQLWVLRSHLGDITVNTGSATQLGASGLVVGALGLSAAGIVLSVFRRSSPRVAAVFVALCMVGGALGAKAIVRESSVIPQVSGLLASQVVVDWMKEFAADGASGLPVSELEGPAATLLASFRDEGRAPLSMPDADWPLYARLPVDADDTAQWRARLGLPARGPIHVHFLFMESTRAYEFHHPEIGPRVFPHLKRLFDEQGIQYTQAYTSSAEAGQTSRGRFSTGCSMLPGIGGPSPAIVLPGLRVSCLPELLQEDGYETAWISAYHAGFHNAHSFESRHGTARFVDATDFRQRGVTEELGMWGLADAPYFEEVSKVVAEVVAEGRPVFTSIINLSTHHPHSVTPEGPLDETLLALTAEDGDYRAYLSRLRYSQEAIARFIERTLEAPGGDATLFVVLGDHSTALKPVEALSPVRTAELLFRVPFALVTKQMSEPGVYDHPLHQIDVAPMVARILGLRGKTSWLGRETALSSAGSPFVFQTQHGVHYRDEQTLCHPDEAGGPTCWQVPPGTDPLFAESLEPAPVDAQRTKYFRDVISASREAVTFNRLRPPPLEVADR